MISPYGPDVRIADDENDLVREVVEFANIRIAQQLRETGAFHLALTGGTLGLAISKRLVEVWNANPEDFTGLHLWWSDERFVPEMSEERNARPIISGLSEDSPIHVHQVLPSDANVDVEVAARRYNADLFGIEIDLTILGLGPDGHVASLFPGQWDESEERNAIAVIDSPKPPRQRVSLSMSKINSSDAVWFVVSGREKHEAVAKIIGRDASIPASHVHGKIETLLFAEHAALATG